MKQCTKCFEWKSKTEFHKHKGRKDGLSNICKSCNKRHANEWYYANKEKALVTCRNWALANTEKVRETHKRWRENNPEQWRKVVSKATNKWRESNPEKSHEVSRNWKTKNVEKNLQINRNYRAKKSGNGGTITEKEWQSLKKIYNYTCLCCKRKEPEIKLTLDHVKPLKLGGKNIIDNAQPLCSLCNSRKGAKEIDYRIAVLQMAREVGVWG